MDDAAFWALIEGRSELALELALAKLPGEEIVSWAARFDAYCEALDRWDLKLATHLILDRWYDPAPVSAWLIAQGRDAVEAAVADPDRITKLGHSFTVQGVAGRAYRRAYQADLPRPAPIELATGWPADRVARTEPWTGTLMRTHLPRLAKKHLGRQLPEHWDAMIPRAEFWRMIDDARGDIAALAQRLDTPTVAIGFDRWRHHYEQQLLHRTGIKVVAGVWKIEPEALVAWLILQGERVVLDAVHEPDTLADCTWTDCGALASIARDAISKLGGWIAPWWVRIPEEAWPDDLPETAANILGSDMLARWLPRLAAKREPSVPAAPIAMPRAAWQVELASRNRWWALAWNALEADVAPTPIDKFWELIDELAWPRKRKYHSLLQASLHVRVAFAMRFHERVAAYGGDDAELAIAGGRDAYEARRTIGAEAGLTAFVDELRRSSADTLGQSLPNVLYPADAAGHEGALVYHLPPQRRAVVGFVVGNMILTHDGLVPMPSPRRIYKPSEPFAIGDLLSHPSFGDGQVIAKLSGKIKIRFGDGQTRVLASKA